MPITVSKVSGRAASTNMVGRKYGSMKLWSKGRSMQ